MPRPKTLVTGVIGSDTHIVGNRILSMALEKAGYKVISLGALTPAGDFVKAAIETEADAIMVSSLYGQGEPVDPAPIYCRTVPKFETGHEKYRWLMENLFVASAARHADHVVIDVFQVL